MERFKTLYAIIYAILSMQQEEFRECRVISIVIPCCIFVGGGGGGGVVSYRNTYYGILGKCFRFLNFNPSNNLANICWNLNAGIKNKTALGKSSHDP